MKQFTVQNERSAGILLLDETYFRGINILWLINIYGCIIMEQMKNRTLTE